MSNTQHSTTPWRVDTESIQQYNIIDDKGLEIASTVTSETTDEDNKANAKRIVACVNFCEGTDNAMLTGNLASLNRDLDRLLKLTERKNVDLMDSYSLIGQYRGQRDALLKAAMKACKLIKVNGNIDHDTDVCHQNLHHVLSDAIATIKRHDHSKDPMMQALQQILKDSAELPHIHEIARKALEKGGAV